LFFNVKTKGVLADPTLKVPKSTGAGLGGVNVTGKMPVPERVTFCGLLAAFPEIVRLPLRGPAAVGVKTTAMLHALVAATVDPVVHVVLRPV
jgi:hypothetical protein